MGARAEAAERTLDRIHEAATALFRTRPFAEVTLQAVAEGAGVTLQTVLRRCGSKERLFQEASSRFAAQVERSRKVAATDDVAGAVGTLVASYEAMGDLAWNGLVQEDHQPLIRARYVEARAMHRRWVEATFGSVLAGLRRAERERRVLLLFGTTDFYLWKLYRRDLGLGRRATTARLVDHVEAVLATFRSAN
ncbi:hypothetical protein TBR22_A17400 [Luteitalea sp. TBR-22]|nr:hypothetical protein TBR22_A17400 [Luteitalea sp. TBR-22]